MIQSEAGITTAMFVYSYTSVSHTQSHSFICMCSLYILYTHVYLHVEKYSKLALTKQSHYVS